MALTIVHGRSGIRVKFYALLPVVGMVRLRALLVCWSIVDCDCTGGMRGSVSVATDRDIRFLRAHALIGDLQVRYFCSGERVGEIPSM